MPRRCGPWEEPAAERPLVAVNFASTVEHYVSLVRKRLNPGGRPQESLLVTGHGGYRIDGLHVWGATARILGQLGAILGADSGM